MALLSVLSESILPERLDAFEEGVRTLAKRAVEKKEGWIWNAHQTAFGELGTFYFVSQAESWSELAGRGTTEAMVQRVLGEKEGTRLLADVRGCLREAQQTISLDRPDLSYPPDVAGQVSPFHVVTLARVRAGGQETFEEFLRKIAEAIPKVDDPGRTLVLQTLVGDLREYRIVRPLGDLRELDAQAAPQDLLLKAFGPAEGGLLFRTGLESLEHVERRILVHRADLSNPRP
jgi:hypothetical protein